MYTGSSSQYVDYLGTKSNVFLLYSQIRFQITNYKKSGYLYMYIQIYLQNNPHFKYLIFLLYMFKIQSYQRINRTLKKQNIVNVITGGTYKIRYEIETKRNEMKRI